MNNNILFDYINSNNISQVEIEIKKYKKINTTNFNRGIRGCLNYTPLHSAVLRNNISMVKLFLNENADPTIKILQQTYPTHGILALYLAEGFGKHNITAILKPYTTIWETYTKYSQRPCTICNYIKLKKIPKIPFLNDQFNSYSIIIYTIILIGYRLESNYYKNHYKSLPILPVEIVMLLLEYCCFNDLGYKLII